jgi:hypothetical protein
LFDFKETDFLIEIKMRNTEIKKRDKHITQVSGKKKQYRSFFFTPSTMTILPGESGADKTAKKRLFL